MANQRMERLKQCGGLHGFPFRKREGLSEEWELDRWLQARQAIGVVRCAKCARVTSTREAAVDFAARFRSEFLDGSG
ncbi:MAG TPA: hypothetical protein VK638_18625 [Edaphobacter sp.]|nr:hypothetical protein [Edaphobacter sp.]